MNKFIKNTLFVVIVVFVLVVPFSFWFAPLVLAAGYWLGKKHAAKHAVRKKVSNG